MPESQGPEFEVQAGDTQEIVSEQDAKDVFALAKQWAEYGDGSISDLHPSNRPGFSVRVTQGQLRIGTDRSSLSRAPVYERGERFKLFPMGQAVYAKAPALSGNFTTTTEFGNEIESLTANVMVERLTAGMDLVESEDRRHVVKDVTDSAFEPIGEQFNGMYPELWVDPHFDNLIQAKPYGPDGAFDDGAGGEEGAMARELLYTTGDDTRLTIHADMRQEYDSVLAVFVTLCIPQDTDQWGSGVELMYRSPLDNANYWHDARNGDAGQVFVSTRIPTKTLVAVDVLHSVEGAAASYSVMVE